MYLIAIVLEGGILPLIASNFIVCIITNNEQIYVQKTFVEASQTSTDISHTSYIDYYIKLTELTHC